MHSIPRRCFCLLLVLVFALSLAACTADPEENASREDAQGETAGISGGGSETGDPTVYNGLFDSGRIHSVDVTVSDEDWADLRANPTDKTKYHATVVIDGETVEEVSFSTKGNTSLSAVAADADSDRYSFKINFGKYNKGQSYHGLNKLNLNNIYADATYLKDFLSYELFRQVGVDAPLVSYVWLTVNGTDHGLYLAIEDVSESWLDRTNDGQGKLYKPETEMLNHIGQEPQNGTDEGPGQPSDGDAGQSGFPGSPGGNGPTPPDGQDGFPGGTGPTPPDGQDGFPGGTGPTPPDGQGGFPGGNGPTLPDGQGGFPGGTGPTPPDGQGGFPGGPGGFGGSSSGADLKYTDDEPDSYSDIFDNDETDADEAARKRVIEALKGLAEGAELDRWLDTEEIICYFAAHNFVLNYDSYTGSMLHNYYLYEKDGKLSMLPWDYNLAFGGFGGSSDVTALLNTGIDSPLSGASEDARPMWAWITADERYLEQYHAACERLLSKYFESGEFEARIDALCTLLRPCVVKDPSAFYTVEEFDRATATLKRFCLLRAQSIRAQLNGELATKSTEQDAAARIDASDLDLSSMGTHGGAVREVPAAVREVPAASPAGRAVPRTGTTVPRTGTTVPRTGTAVPRTGTAVRRVQALLPAMGPGRRTVRMAEQTPDNRGAFCGQALRINGSRNACPCVSPKASCFPCFCFPFPFFYLRFIHNSFKIVDYNCFQFCMSSANAERSGVNERTWGEARISGDPGNAGPFLSQDDLRRNGTHSLRRAGDPGGEPLSGPWAPGGRAAAALSAEDLVRLGDDGAERGRRLRLSGFLVPESQVDASFL